MKKVHSVRGALSIGTAVGRDRVGDPRAPLSPRHPGAVTHRGNGRPVPGHDNRLPPSLHARDAVVSPEGGLP